MCVLLENVGLLPKSFLRSLRLSFVVAFGAGQIPHLGVGWGATYKRMVTTSSWQFVFGSIILIYFCPDGIVL